MVQQTITGINFSNTTSTTSRGLYSFPELISTIVLPDCIKLVYKRQSMISTGLGMPNPEIYAEVYSRMDGSMRVVNGEYTPAQPESYLLDE